ncbi:hypothetical protein H696_01749 [Fonticula alba]|uniref:Endonuclease I n=1 Tax=Fonticula alba TaxID=691883 RepID=A0A058ZEI1_FONAL|nr:hypothetical protein H696_01749 [Fonticula alba]KCV72356.1 hypothetical protein H696_01749 [Fonticula alba]|eukprot:XP_009493934.1 hypothetical protein H696_01749 [Fonticula alba]
MLASSLQAIVALPVDNSDVIEVTACKKPSIPPFNSATYYKDALAVQKDANRLRATLSSLLHKGTYKHSYSCVWDILDQADQVAGSPSHVNLIYSQQSFPKSQKDTGGSGSYWNREHVWAKSHGFPSESMVAYTDAHHLRACEKNVNSYRGDRDFHDQGSQICLNPYKGSLSGCKAIGTSASGTFGPPKGSRGEVARMIFYMEARYTGQSSNTPALTIVNSGTSSGQPRLGYLCRLLAWHRAEPVNALERQRNNVIYSWQGNRNPFIDYPAWVETLWGKKC